MIDVIAPLIAPTLDLESLRLTILGKLFINGSAINAVILCEAGVDAGDW